jgi:predicted O-methyltransferase YrrM
MDHSIEKPGHLRASGTSLGNLWELLHPLLDAVRGRSVVEIGAFRGELTSDLLNWAAQAKAHVVAVDPEPAPALEALGQRHPELELIRQTGVEALRQISSPDAVIIDGDHNYYTVSEELRAIDERFGASGPLLMFHDVGWPLSRRDTYHAPDRVPEEHRQPLLPAAGLSNEPDFAADQPFAYTAAIEGGAHNGVLTAIEDFAAKKPAVRLAVVPAFFGFGVLWCTDAPWANAVAKIVHPFDHHAVLERLERDRVVHLLTEQARTRQLAALQMRLDEVQQQLVEKDQRIQQIIDSRTYAFASRLSRLRRGSRATQAPSQDDHP